MAGGGSEKGKRRGGRRPGSKNKPKGHDLIVRLDDAEREVRKIILSGDKITSLGKDRLAELDDWAYSIAQDFAPKRDEKGRVLSAQQTCSLSVLSRRASRCRSPAWCSIKPARWPKLPSPQNT